MKEMQVRSLGWEDPLEKEMATHSRILAWEIPWTEEPGRLQSTGSQRVGHDWAIKTTTQISFNCNLWFVSGDPLTKSVTSLPRTWVSSHFLRGPSGHPPPKGLPRLSPPSTCGFYRQGCPGTRTREWWNSAWNAAWETLHEILYEIQA